MKDVLELLYWLRGVWEAKSTLVTEEFWSMEAVDFFSLWVTDLVHVGRTYEAD